MELMSIHLASRSVAEASSWLLITLAASDDSRTHLGDIGACEVVSEALQQHSASARLCESLCWTVKNLSYRNDDNRSRFGSLGACELVAGALMRHPNNVQVSKAVWGAIVNLSCDNSENKLRFDGLGDVLGLGFMKY